MTSEISGLRQRRVVDRTHAAAFMESGTRESAPGIARAVERRRMAVTLTREAGRVFRLDVSGVVGREDLVQAQQKVADAIGREGPIRLLVLVNRFKGFSAGRTIADMDFYQTYGDRIDRIAIVADDRWREQMMLFAGAGLRRSAVEFYVRGAISLAREWLAA